MFELTDSERQALDYLQKRHREIDGRYRDKYPKWTTADLVNVRILIRVVEKLRSSQTPQTDER